MYFDKIKEEVVEIIVNQLNYQKIFLIGDNMTGKTEICNMVKDKDDSIEIFDNYNDKYSNLPNDKRILVVTHNMYVVKFANPLDKIIMLKRDSIYCIKDVESSNDVENYFYALMQDVTLKYILSSLLNNATEGIWSDLNQYYLDFYKKEKKLENSDWCIINLIENLKENCVYLT